MGDWQAFQTDVLDALRQYEGFFDFMERIGSLSDDSRPDTFCRISREDKKEVWVVDAKNKPSIDEGDLRRMEKYVEMLKSKPLDVGLEMGEIEEYEFRGIFVTSAGDLSLEKFEQVKSAELHQFLQRELVYTDTDRVVRDVAKMAERSQLSQSQMRLLFQSVKPFEKKLETVLEELGKLETRYIGLELMEPPLSSFEFQVPVDAVLRHGPRNAAFLIDVPYREEDLEVREKIEKVKDRMDSIEKDLYYAAVSTFGERDLEHVYTPERLENELRETAGILPPEYFARLYTPNVPTETFYEEDYVEVRDSRQLGFRLRIWSEDDVRHRIEVNIGSEAASRIKDNRMNARSDFGEVIKNSFRQEVEVTEDLDIRHDGGTQDLANYRDSVSTVYSSAVNPVFSREIKKKV
ncbi:MAG: hypothetical protein ABEK01_00450 [Candidatus Nanohaloarchaea archaeon]